MTIDLGHTTCGDDRVAPLEGVGDDVVVFNPHLLAHIHPQTGAGDRERRLRLFGVDGEHGFVEDHLVSHRSGHADTKQKQDDQSEDEFTSRVVDDLGLATPPFPGVRLLVVFAATVFLSAFLLFQVQPIIGKYILPWFGSTPGVWATSLLFFQLMLLAGYAYAHFILGPMSWRRQAIVHISLLVLALVTLPITPAEALKPAGPDSPIGRILAILTLSVGAPYFVLSATAPLLQMWFASLVPGRSPYRLYALSNAGSLLALLSYPFLVERLVPLRAQMSIWSVGYVVFAGLCGACAWSVTRPSAEHPSRGDLDAEAADTDGVGARIDALPGVGTALMWIALSACGSGLLLATTNQITLDIAVVPFLWIVPLALYLLTFILCFDSDRWYIRPLFAALLPVALVNAVRLLYRSGQLEVAEQVLGYAFTLFVCCMVCHGELARMRPAPRHLTFFFLMVAVGGALGGTLVAIVAPAMFVGLYEYQVLLVACYTLAAIVVLPKLFRFDEAPKKSLPTRVFSGLCWGAALVVIALGAYKTVVVGTWVEANSTATLEVAFLAWRVSFLLTFPYAVLAFLLVLEVWRRMEGQPLIEWWSTGRGLARFGTSAMVAAGLWFLGGAFSWQVGESGRSVIAQARNFYGTLVIRERFVGASTHQLSLTHGNIRHGLQLQRNPTWPTSYFGPETGVGLAVRHHPARSDSTRQFRVGVVGLGVGTMAAYSNAHVDPDHPDETYVRARVGGVPDYTRFYEINPRVELWSRERFTYLEDAASRGDDVDVLMGDARIVLERQLAEGDAQRFDLLVVDAFNSDAIPIHLLTLESVETYLAHLADDGILAIHVSNRYVDLVPIVASLAAAADLSALYIEHPGRIDRQISSTDWILLTNNREFLDTRAVHEFEESMPVDGPLWTDDFSSVWEVVELRR